MADRKAVTLQEELEVEVFDGEGVHFYTLPVGTVLDKITGAHIAPGGDFWMLTIGPRTYRSRKRPIWEKSYGHD